MTSWQLQTAKAKFSALIRDAKTKGPQAITRHGRTEAVILSKESYDAIRRPAVGLVEFLRASPFRGVSLNLRRNTTRSRTVEI